MILADGGGEQIGEAVSQKTVSRYLSLGMSMDGWKGRRCDALLSHG
jgi:hypothetical protein